MLSLKHTLSLSWLVAAASARHCQDITVPVTISAENTIFDLEKPTTKIQATDFILNLTQQGHDFAADISKGKTNVTGTYKLATTYCTPDSGPGGAVQLLTHGIGFDRSYWDFAFENGRYSYVNPALAAGYSTLSWDRLGVGHSAHGDPVAEIQASLEIAALKALTDKLRAGDLPGVAHAYDKVVHVGHSFGAVQTYALASRWPDASDAIVLTGFTNDPTFIPYFALAGNFVPVGGLPAFAGKYAPGYLAPSSIAAVQANFFAPGQFDHAVLDKAYATGQPVAPGEMLSLAGPLMSPNEFAGPVFIITGERDIPFCGGDCTIPTNSSFPDILAESKPYFPKAYLETKIIPKAGHGLNLEYGCKTVYSSILNFLSEQVDVACKIERRRSVVRR